MHTNYVLVRLADLVSGQLQNGSADCLQLFFSLIIFEPFSALNVKTALTNTTGAD